MDLYNGYWETDSLFMFFLLQTKNLRSIDLATFFASDRWSANVAKNH